MKTHLSILIVDDSKEDREIYRNFFLEHKDTKWVILEAVTGEEALEIIDTTKLDAVLLDCMLPKIDGISVLKKLRKDNPHLAVVMLTGGGTEIMAAQALKEGAHDYLLKENINGRTIVEITKAAVIQADTHAKIEEQRQVLKNYAGILTHDLKAPIRNIFELANLIEHAIEQEEYNSLREYNDYLQKSAKTAYNYINTLNQYNQIGRENIQFTEVNVEDLLQNVLRNLNSVIVQSNAEVTYDPLPEIICNEYQMEQLFQNLVSNGIKYCRNPVPRVNIRAEENVGSWVFSVEDNGIGISEKHASEIFNMFKRLHNMQGEFEGSGIGLAICKKIIERHHGKIWFISEPSGGATFFFSISKYLITPKSSESVEEKIELLELKS